MLKIYYSFIHGIKWTLISCLISNFNDVVMRFLGERLSSFVIIFFRFFFGLVWLFFFHYDRKSQKKNITITPYSIHFIRAAIGATAIILCCYSVNKLPLAVVTILSFTQPIILLPLASFFLNEKLDRSKILSTLVGFIGVILIIFPQRLKFQWYLLLPLLSALLFAILDLLTKKLVKEESPFLLAFYFSAGALVLIFPFAIYNWVMPTVKEILFLLLLGAGGILIQISVCKAFENTDIIVLAPFRYAEIIASILFGYLLFKETPHVTTLLGALIIFLSLVYLIFQELTLKKIK